MGGDESALPIPVVRVGDSAEAKRAAYAEFLAATRAALGDGAKGDAAEGVVDAVAALSTLTHLLSRLLPHASWTGFYRANGDDGSLIVGPYVGTSMGCLRIAKGKGVCGSSAQARRTVVVPDVDAFRGHIACSSSTRSELVAPVFEGGDSERGNVVAVVDLDSETEAAFDEADAAGIEALCAYLGSAFFPKGGGAAGAAVAAYF